MAQRDLTLVLRLRDELSKSMAEINPTLAKAQKGFAIAGAAVTSMAGAMADLAREGAGDVAAMEAVRVAVANSGAAWEDAEGPISEYIDRMRDTAAIADDQMKPALAGLVAVTQDYDKAMRLASLAADLARGKNMDLQTAAILVGKVAEGNVSVLKRYGITLAENATAEEALAELQKRFAGQSEAYAQTTKGQMEILSLKIGDFREDIGSAINEVAPFIALLPGLSAGWTAAGAAVGFLSENLSRKTIALVASKVAMVATTAATAAWTAAQWLLNLALSANPIGVVITAIAALAAGIIWAYQNVDWFRNAVDAAFSFLQEYVPKAIQVVGDAITWWYDNTLKPVIDAIGWLLGKIGELGSMSFPDIKIPGFAQGGIVPGPIGRPMLAMVHGGETITPSGRGGGGINVIVNVQGSVTAERDLAETIRRELIYIKQSNRTTGL